MAAFPKIDTQPCLSMHDFWSMGEDQKSCRTSVKQILESIALDGNASRRWAPWYLSLFPEQWREQSVSPWTIADNSQVFLVDVLCTRLESWLPGSRPGLSVWKSDLLSWLVQG